MREKEERHKRYRTSRCFCCPSRNSYRWSLGNPTERVTYQTCFIKAVNYRPNSENCLLLNYAELFLAAIGMAIIGLYLIHRSGS